MASAVAPHRLTTRFAQGFGTSYLSTDTGRKSFSVTTRTCPKSRLTRRSRNDPVSMVASPHPDR